MFWKRAIDFHGHVCGDITIGYKAVMYVVDSYKCECCGEVAGVNGIRIQNGKKVCLDCYKAYDRFNV